MFDYPAEGTRRVRVGTAQPADPAPPVEAGPGRAETAHSKGMRRIGVMLHGAPEQPRRSGRQLCQTHSFAV
jgi:hypothetical protein